MKIISSQRKFFGQASPSNVPIEGSIVPNAILYPNLKIIKPPQSHRKIALPTVDGICFERIQDIICLTADGNYTSLHFKDTSKSMVCKTLLEMEKSIGAYRQFVRVHRSFTINLDYLKKYVKGKGGYCIMENGMNISVSAGKKSFFLKTLEEYF